nr:MAG TPA: hypothetical protein [Caudoviricetes sp.]
MTSSAKNLVTQLKKTFTTVSVGYKNFKDMDEAVRGSGSSFSDYIKWASESEGATEAFGLATLYAKARVIALNMAVGAGIGLVVSYFSKKIIEAAQRTDKLAESSKEAADAATSTKSSLKDLADEYENLGDKSSWDADDMEKAQEIQDEILQLAKEQSTLDENKVNKIDLQNGKYEDQLAVLKKIREEQVRASTDDYEDDKRRQGQKLVSDAKSTIGGGYVLTSSFDHNMAEDLQAQGFNLFKGISNNSLVIGPEDPNDPQSVLDWYDDLTEALKVLRKQYSDADLEEKGIYEGLYNILSAQKEALDDQVAAYRDSADVLKKNKEEVGKYDLSNDLSASKTFMDNLQPLSDSEEAKIDSKIQKTKEYQDAVEEAQETEAKWESSGFNKYGNVDNFNRDKIDWTKENLEKYKDFVDEQNKFSPGSIEEGSYSTVLGTYDNLYRESQEMPLMAYTPMLQTEDGLVPLTEDQVRSYIETIAEECWTEDDTIDLDKLMKLDATGLERDINGEMIRVKGMIAGVEGGIGSDGKTLTKADIMAISGSSNDEIAQELYGGEIGDYSGMGWLSKYVSRSMHDAQAAAQEGKDNVEQVYDDLYNDLAYGSDITEKNKLSDSLQDAFNDIADSLGKDSRELTVSDVLGLTADDVELTDEQAAAIDVLTEAAEKYKTSVQGVAEAGEENGLFGGIENAINGAAKAAQEMDAICSKMDDIQSAYKSCTTAAEEYNKYGYMSVDSLQALLQMDNQYIDCLDLVNGKLQVNKQGYADLLATQYANAAATILHTAQLEIEQLTVDDTTDSTDALKEVTEDEKAALEEVLPALKNAASATAVYGAAQEYAASVEDARARGVDPAKIEEITERTNKKLSLLYANMNEALKGGQGLANQLNGFSSASKNASSSTKGLIDAWSTLSSAMKEFNEQGYITFQTLKSLTDLGDKYNSMLVKNDTTGLLEIQTDKFYDLMKAELKEAQTKGDGQSETRYNKILEWTDRNIKKQTMSYWDLVAAIEGYSAALSGAKEITDGFKDAWDNGKTVKEKSEKSRTGALDYEGTEAQSAALQSIKKYSQYDPDLINKAYNKDTGKIDLSGDVLKNAVVESLKQQAEAARTEGGAASEAIARSYEIAKENIENDVISVQDYFDGLGSTVEEFNSKIDDMQSAWTDLSDVTNEYNTYGGLSVDSIQKLLTMSPEYLQFLKMEGGQLVFNKEAMLAKTKADILAKAAELELKEETKDQAEILRALADSLDKGADSMEGMGKSAEKLKTLMSQLNTVLNSFIGVFDDLNDKQSNDLKIQGEAWIDVIDKRIDALNEENDAQERAIELAKLQDEYERAKANKTVHVYGGRGQGFVWKADENAVREAGQNLSDKQREYKKQDEIDKLEKLKDKVQETNNLIGTSWDDYQKKLKYTAEFEAMTFEQMEGHYDGFKGNVLNNMQAIQGATNVKNVITDISNLISTLETLANILNLLNGGTGDGGGVFGFINQIKNMFTGENGDFDLGGGFKKMFDGAAKVVSDGWNWITGKNRAGSAALKSDTTATLDILGNTIKVNTGDIQRVSGGFFERLVGAAKDNLGSIGKFFSGA